ncbi:SDR family NAD(P)-dependent oxidoreductase [Candidatus Pelagibacter bacterium nBUS_36]|uniref:SDR family NAD(P)-dependent oxidoreductase n=1 Tax=Candidatus Pelagibacter bacterium nBUS_36 TaxID=3374194 RepID=UPI003EC0A004
MIKNIIIGQNSSVSKICNRYLKNTAIISANELNINKINNEINKYKKINLILNNFYPSRLLNDLNKNNYQTFCNLSLEKIILLLEKIPSNKINKIIYTSSASVYRIAENISDPKKDHFNRELYSVFKLAAEKIIINYAFRENKDYYIMRIFNTFGYHADNFSFIEKIIRAKKNRTKITLINQGLSLRDFIHLDDVGKIYSFFINKKFIKGVYDIGTGNGYLIKDIVNLAKIPIKKLIKINKIEEIQNSIANTKNLISQIGNYKFKNIDYYMKKELKLKKNIKLQSFVYEKKNNYIKTGVVIYGAGYSGKQILNELKKNNEDVLCFVDDNLKLQNSLINEIPVISYENLLKIKEHSQIKRVYLTIPSLKKKSQIKILKKIKKNFFDVRFLPEKKFLVSDQINFNDLKIDEINNILDRDQIKIKKIKKLVNKKILVTGAGGTIGSEICRQLIQQKVKKVIALDKSELAIYNLQNKIGDKKIIFKLLDINNINFLEKIIKKEKIDIIFHAAAYKHVNILEKNIFSAVKNNIFATYNLCILSKKYFCDMVLISTDKAANPKSILGYSKRVAEKICQHFNKVKNNKNFINIVRFGNVFGSSGSAINNFLEQINTNNPINLTDIRATRYFMTILEACHLVLQTTEIKSKKDIFVLNMGKPLNILNLARNLARIKSRINPNYKFKYSVIGLQPGEKLHETIVDKKESKKKYNNEIFLVNSKMKKNTNFIKYYQNLRLNYDKQNENELLKQLKNIIKY